MHKTMHMFPYDVPVVLQDTGGNRKKEHIEHHIPLDQLICLWGFLSLWMAKEDIVLSFLWWACPYIAGCKTLFLAVTKVTNLP